MTKYIFITGGVVSSLGKGITTASIGALLKICGYNKIRFIKMDPYLNVDPGTMDPFEHGEVYVTQQGDETDLDLGHYERFTEIKTDGDSNITSGKLYMELLSKERKGNYLGSTVQIVPHLTDDIKSFIKKNNNKYDFVLCEVGGTVGDIEATPMIEAIRQFRMELPKEDTVSVHVTLVPMLKAAGELKTKPTQHSVKQLMEHGIIPDLIVCRTSYSLDTNLKSKIARYSNLTFDRIIEGIDMDTIYDVPLYYAKQNMIDIILSLTKYPAFDLKDLEIIQDRKNKWLNLKNNITVTDKQNTHITVAIVGKYVSHADAYKSLVEALNHASWAIRKKINIKWLNARELDESDIIKGIMESTCVIIPGGFGKEGIQNKMVAIKYCRQNKIPILGICLGMQLMVVEYSQNVLEYSNAISSEWLTTKDKHDPEIMSQHVISVGFIEEWMTASGMEKRNTDDNLGGTMRLGSFYTEILSNTSRLWKYYNNNKYYQNTSDDKYIEERHRHRYEVNKNYIDELSKAGLITSGISPKDGLPEVVEMEGHPYFIGCQFHPEFQSTPFTPRPLFIELLVSCN
jgi:CTP synthase